MRKHKASYLILTLALAAMILLTACGGSGSGGDVLKGTWEGRSQDMAYTWTFDGKGGCKTENEFGIKDEGTYTIDGNDVTIKLSYWDGPIVYQYKIDGDQLSLTTDEPLRPTYELTKK
jgi:hypothetical protein